MKRRVFLGAALAVAAAGGFKVGLLQARDRFRWELKSADVGLPERDCGAPFTFNGRIWISNGYQRGGICLRDLHVSDSGAEWQLVNAATPYADYAPVGVHDGWIWFIDTVVRRTRDGVNYEIVPASNMPARYDAQAHMFYLNGKFHIVGPSVVRHYDPATSIFSETPLPYPPRTGGAAVLFDGRISVMAGADDVGNFPPEKHYANRTSLNDVWSTDDPENVSAWVRHADAAWTTRMWPGIVVHDRHLYIVGGYENRLQANVGDTWRTSDLEYWERIETQESYPARHASTLFSRNGRLVMVAGNTNKAPGVQKDAWELVRI